MALISLWCVFIGSSAWKEAVEDEDWVSVWADLGPGDCGVGARKVEM